MFGRKDGSFANTRIFGGRRAGDDHYDGALLYAGHGSLAAKPVMKASKMKVASAAGSVSQGKALVSKYRCNGCHNTAPGPSGLPAQHP